MKKWHHLLTTLVLGWTLMFVAVWPGGCTDDGGPKNDSGISDGEVTTPTDQATPTELAPPVLKDDGDPVPTTKVPCPPTLESFREKLWEPLLSTQCLSCHHDQGAAKASRFVLRFPSEPDALTANLKIAMQTAAIIEDGASILLSRPTSTHKQGHPGGALVSQGSAIYTDLRGFIDAATGVTKDCKTNPPPSVSCDEKPPGSQALRRLTRLEYDNTISDLFGFASRWGRGFVADNVIEGFDNNADALTVTPLLADQLRIAAEEIAAEAIKQPGRLLPCDATNSPTRQCAETWIRSFGAKAYREPLTQGQVDALLALFDLGAKESFLRGIELTITGMLQSPFFLYRRELGTKEADGMYHLSGYEIASSLSYLFWGTMPDEALFNAAKSGALRKPEEIATQAKRLLASPKSRFVYEQFFTQWLLVQRISSVPKDAAIFAAFTPEIRAAMAEEFKRFVWHVMEQKNGTLDEILTLDQSVINKSLATFYQLPVPTTVDASGYGVVTFADGNRGGLLSLGSVLAVHGRPDSSSPIHRGVLVRERMLCQHLPPPPANVDAEPPGLDPNKTTRDRYVQHSQDPTCKGCHSLIDPIGFGFENFDGIGRFRTMEGTTKIDVHGEILNAPHTSGTFNGLGELSSKLAKSKDVHECFTLQWMRWAYGTKAKQELKCALKDVSEGFSTGGRDIKQLLIALTQTSHFRMRLPAAGVAATNPGPSEPSGNEPPPDTADAGTPDNATPPPPPADLKVDVTTQSKWDAGYCNQVTVTNLGSSDATWSIQLEVQGTINQLWNAVSSGSGAKLNFSGVEWNRVLTPNQSAQFGFCATL